MKLKLIAMGSVVAAVLTQTAMANSGKIDFDGGITATTCEVNINNQGKDATVNLPTVSSTLLKTAGDVAGRTFIAFRLRNCTVAENPGFAKVFFKAGNTINASGRLDIDKTITGPANHVDLQILDPDLKAVDLTQDADGQGGTRTQIIVNSTTQVGTADMLYYVQYYATGPVAVVPGKVKSSVEYEINYE